uniref:Uncharacterized protein n=1 Tax=Acrobeloides nanus TaxID=290746 RepID=A0A914D815_9BILA
MDPRIEPVQPDWYFWLARQTRLRRPSSEATLKFAQYRLAFRRCYDTREPIRMPLTIGIDLSQQYESVPARMPFNPLHFDEKLFQQYCIDTFIYIQWIKDNQKVQVDKYGSVTDS